MTPRSISLLRLTDGSGDIQRQIAWRSAADVRDGMGVVVEGRYMTNGVFELQEPDGEALERISSAQTW